MVPTQITRVALFKNGLAFFLRHGALPAQTGPIEIGPLPAASHGTLWLAYGSGVKLANLASGETKTVEMREALTIPELLQANLGKKVRLEFGDQYRPSLEGTLKSFPRPQTPLPPSPYLAGGVVLPPRPGGTLLLIQTAAGLVALNPAVVDRITFLEDASSQFPEETRKVALTGDLTATAPQRELTVSYLAKGMTWAPSYVVDISDPKEALLTAKAEILNETEDLTNASVDLVTGFPYLEYSDILSPLAHKEDLASFLNSLAQGSSAGGRREYGALTQRVMMNAYDAVGPAGAAGPQGPMPEYGAAAVGTVTEDLFLYPLSAVNLKKDSVGYYPLFSAKVPYQHVYEWEIPDYVNEQDNYQRPPETQKQPEIVWHSLRLTNTTKMPWTTAPGETLKDNNLLGQATLSYTAVGGETLLKITQALGIKAQQIELETNREVNALQRYGYSYDRVTVEGHLVLHNYTAGAVTVKITKTVTGEVQASAPEAKIDKLAKGLRQENPRSRLVWEVPADPGKDVEVTYSYKVLIRR
jgi:hypothetical protein